MAVTIEQTRTSSHMTHCIIIIIINFILELVFSMKQSTDIWFRHNLACANIYYYNSNPAIRTCTITRPATIMRMRITRGLATRSGQCAVNVCAVHVSSIILTTMAMLTLICLQLALFTAFILDGVVARQGQSLL